MGLMQGSPLPNITTTQTQQTTAPSWYTDYLSNLASKATAGAAGATYAGAQPLQQQAFAAAGKLPGTYQPTLAEATKLASGVGATDIATRAGQLMSPYTTQVVDALGALGKRNIEQFLAPQATAGAVGTGQFGSKRGAQALGEAINVGLQNLSAEQSKALQTGYSQALLAAQEDQRSKLQAAQQLGALATTGQGMGLADINALATLGAQQQTIAQNEQLFPLQTLNLSTQALRGYSVPTGSTASYTGPIPGAYSASPLAQITGLGAFLAGASDTQLGKTIGSKLSGLLRAMGGQPGEGTSLIANPATPGTPGYGWQYYNDGTAIDPQGNYYYQGELVYVNPVTAGDQEGDFDLTGPEEPPAE